MKQFINANGVSTRWLHDKPTDKELARLNIEQLIMVAERQKGFKKLLLDFLSGKEIKL